MRGVTGLMLLAVSCVLLAVLVAAGFAGETAAASDPVVHVEEDGSVRIIGGGDIHLQPGAAGGSDDGGTEGAVYFGSQSHVEMMAQLRDAQAMLEVMQREQGFNLPECDGIAPYTLDCASQSSRAAVAQDKPCEALGIVNCCCEEARTLRRVNGDVYFWNTNSLPQPDARDMAYATLGHITHVAGLLVIKGAPATHISLGRLEHVGVSVAISDNPQLTRIDMPALANVVEGLGVRNNSALNNITAPVLTHLGTRLLVLNNPSLPTMSLPSLQYIHTDVLMQGNPQLASLAATQLRYVGGDVTLVASEGLDSIDLDQLAHIGGTFHVHSTGLVSLEPSALVTIGEDLSISDNRHLRLLDMPSLEVVGGFLNATHNRLTHVSFSRLTTVAGSLRLSGNSLTTFSYDALTRIAGDLDLRMNDLRFFTVQPLTGTDRVLLQDNKMLNTVECAAVSIRCLGVRPRASVGILCPPPCE